jgi:hypothetical protein
MGEMDVKWENLCKRCGRCCHIKYRVGKEVIIDPEIVCKHLQEDNSCAIYDCRLSTHCVSIVEVLQKYDGLVPATCGYLQGNTRYRPALSPETMEEFWELVVKHGTVCMIKLERLLPNPNSKRREIKVE